MNADGTPGTVLVTGGSGYIAGYLIRLLAAGGWTVHTSVRQRSTEAALRRRLAVDDARLRVFPAELTADAGWAEACAGCTHVAHLASPVAAEAVRDPDVLVAPARDGTLRVLRAARDAGVRRFVMTSSVAAIAYGRGRGVHHLTETDWTDLRSPGLSPYVRSKTIAERSAREWVDAQSGTLEFCSICPSVVLGPVWSADYSPSVQIVQRLLAGELKACPDFGFGVVDVRDLAELHRLALVTPGLAGERFIASGPYLTLLQVAQVLRSHLGDAARRVPTRALPDWAVRLAALVNPLARAVVHELGSVRQQDASHARKVLGWVTRPAEASIVDAARSLLDLGLVKP